MDEIQTSAALISTLYVLVLSLEVGNPLEQLITEIAATNVRFRPEFHVDLRGLFPRRFVLASPSPSTAIFSADIRSGFNDDVFNRWQASPARDVWDQSKMILQANLLSISGSLEPEEKRSLILFSDFLREGQSISAANRLIQEAENFSSGTRNFWEKLAADDPTCLEDGHCLLFCEFFICVSYLRCSGGDAGELAKHFSAAGKATTG